MAVERVVAQILFFLFAIAVGYGDAAFFAEGRIGKHIVVTVPGIGDQGVIG
jgi:C4-dicarboxylate transporter